MHRSDLALFLLGIVIVGAAPLVMLVVWAIRRRSEREARRGSAALAALSSVVVLAVVWGVGYLVASPGGEETHDVHDAGQTGSTLELPRRLAGHRITSELTGPEAIDAVTQLHGTSFPIVSAVVGRYGDGTVEIWASTTEDATMAAEMTERMATSIAEGGSPFGSPVPVAGVSDVWETRGMGQLHYFFARGDVVWWITAEPDTAPRVLERVLEDAA